MTPPTISLSTSGAEAHRSPVDAAADPAQRNARARIAALVEAGQSGAALKAIELLVEEVFCEPLNTAEIFADPFLDEACQRIGAAALHALPPADAAAPEPVPVVFVASRLQESGGHTAVLADIARLTDAPVKVLLTRVGGGTDPARLAHVFEGVRDLSFECAPRGDRAGKLRWLQQRLRALQPRTVWLFNHHQDSVAVAGVQPGQGYTLKYLHHGDHHLCLGASLAFGEHHDPHPMGFFNCREVLGRADNKYLPMAVPDPGAPPAGRVAGSGALVTCTVAGSNKLEHGYTPDYADVVADLLAQTGGTHVHAGRLSLAYRWRIRRALARRGVDARAFRYLGPVRSVTETLLREQVDLYLGSFPHPAARTLVEVLAAGVPIAAHDHPRHRFLSAMDMLPPGSCLWSAPEELLRFVAERDRQALRRLGARARQHFEAYHTEGAMRAALAGDAQAQQVPRTAFLHRDDAVSQALERARAFTLAGLLRRWAMRTRRRLRSSLF